MIEARRASVWKRRYEFVTDERRLATFAGSAWTSGGSLEVGGRRYDVRCNLIGSRYEMRDEGGGRVASAQRVGRKDWTIEADGTTYQFHRTSPWRQEEELHVDGRRVGSVRRRSIWRGDAVSDLPGLPLAVEAFVLAVALTKWDSDAAAAG